MLGDQKRITTINNLKTINTNIRNIQIYLISKRYLLLLLLLLLLIIFFFFFI